MTEPHFVTGGALRGTVVSRIVDEQEGVEAARAQARIGECLGPYTLVRLLGTGGMGDVYLAERVEANFTQQVALKLVRSGRIDVATRDRFERERQILGGLRHANIASLLDVGEAEDGHPYYTMEYVDGVPLSEHCHAHALSVPDRVRLLIQVAGALAYAHANLVVHRDIKPNNVLVGKDGVAKLLDFGISKFAPADADTSGTQTIGLLTPEYAAPEQFTGGPVTIATDIYQFGVLCFRVLTGRRPYRTASTDGYRWSKAVVEEDPLTLSQAFGDSDGQPTGYPASTLRHARRCLTRDLDAIVHKALAKQPADRYRSMNSVVDDLEAFLDDRPVIARRIGMGQMALRQVKRHPYVSTFAVMALCAVVGTTVVALDQAAEARHQAAATRRHSERANEEAKNATALTNFLLDLFSVTDPRVNRGENLTANQILERGAAKVERDLASQPESQARMLAAIGMVYDKLGDHPRSEDAYVRAVKALATADAPHAIQKATLLRLLAYQLFRRSENAQASERLDEAESLLIKLGQAGFPELAMVETVRGAIHSRQGELNAAQHQYEMAVVHLEGAGDEYDYYAAMNDHNLGMLLYTKADFSGARKHFEKSIEIYEKINGHDNPDVDIGHAFVARTHIAEGEWGMARSLLEPAVQRLKEAKSDYAASLMEALGNLYRRMGECVKSSEILEETIALTRQELGEESEWFSSALREQGLTRLAAGQWQEGTTLIQRASDTDHRVLPQASPSFTFTYHAMAIASLTKERFDLATDYAQKALAVIDSPAPRDDPQKAEVLFTLGFARHMLGDEAGAQTAWSTAIGIAERLTGETSPASKRLRARIEHPDLASAIGACHPEPALSAVHQ